LRLGGSLLDKSFQAGIAIKGFDGLLECIGGVLIWFIKPSAMNEFLRIAALHDLPGKYDEFIIAHLFHWTQSLANGGRVFASVYLITHGLSKALLVAGLWMNKLWAYPLTIIVFGLFCVYQMHRYTHTHSIFLVLLTIFDLILIYLTWQEYLKKKRELAQSTKTSEETPKPSESNA
jgi:uncharacterized membrane protein